MGWWLALALCLGCTEDHRIIASTAPPDGGTCLPDDASVVDAAAVVGIVGVALPRIGHLSGCHESLVAPDASSCADPADLGSCINPVYLEAGAPTFQERYGRCACELDDAGTR